MCIRDRNISDSILKSGEVNGDIYGICSGMNTKALLVNEDVLKETGVTLPMQPTYEELFDAAKVIYEKTGMQIEIPSNDEQSMLQMCIRDRSKDVMCIVTQVNPLRAATLRGFFFLLGKGKSQAGC